MFGRSAFENNNRMLIRHNLLHNYIITTANGLLDSKDGDNFNVFMGASK
jgi:hypothetical protein